jgi:hypothetical protein
LPLLCAVLNEIDILYLCSLQPKVLSQLDLCGLKRSVYTYSILIKALTNDAIGSSGDGIGRKSDAKQHHQRCTKSFASANSKGKRRNARLALQYFMEMTQERNIPPNNSVTSCLIHCLCTAGLSHEAKSLFFILIGAEHAAAGGEKPHSRQFEPANYHVSQPELERSCTAPPSITMPIGHNSTVAPTTDNKSNSNDSNVNIVGEGTMSAPASLLSPFLSPPPPIQELSNGLSSPSVSASPLQQEHHHPFDFSSNHFMQHLEVKIPHQTPDNEGFSSAVSTPTTWWLESSAPRRMPISLHCDQSLSSSLSPFLSPPSTLSPFIQQNYSYVPSQEGAVPKKKDRIFDNAVPRREQDDHPEEKGATHDGIANMKQACQDGKSNRDVNRHTVGAGIAATIATSRMGKHPQDNFMKIVQKYDIRSGALVLKTPNIITYTKLMVSFLRAISKSSLIFMNGR